MMPQTRDEFCSISSSHGGLIPISLAAELIGVCRRRVYFLVENERFSIVTFRGWRLLLLDEVTAYALGPRKPGSKHKST